MSELRVGTVCYATEQGLGYLAKSFYDIGLIQEVLIFRHPHRDRPTKREWFPNAPVLTVRPFQGTAVEEWLGKINVALFFETPFDWTLANRCRERGIKTVLTPIRQGPIKRSLEE